MDTISSVALWRITSTSSNWVDIGSSNVKGKKINPFEVGYNGKAPLYKIHVKTWALVGQYKS